MRKPIFRMILALAMLACMMVAGTVTARAETPSGEPNYLYIKNTSVADTNLQWTKTGNDYNVILWYSYDKTQWKKVNVSTTLTTANNIPLAADQTVYFKGALYNNSVNSVSLKNTDTSDNASLEAGGDVTTLLNAGSELDNDCGNVKNLGYNHAFFGLFSGLKSLKNIDFLVLP